MASLSFAGLAALSVLALYGLARAIYNLFFHPLARFPGPFLFRTSRLPYVYKMLRGTLALDMLALHERYGPVVRIAPDQLAFSSQQAWKDIYGHRAVEMPKARIFYRSRNIPPSIISEDRENHAYIRKLMSNGFSDRSMREQEPIIGSYVDLLIKQLREHAVDWNSKDERTGLQKKRSLDMVSWYNWTTFDIIGDLAFGEPFGCLDRAEYHPWVAAIWATLRSTPWFLAVKFLGLEPLLTPILRMYLKGRKQHNKRTHEKLLRRMEMDAERPDLIQGLVSKKDEIGFERLLGNASTLIIAGSETTATLLSGATYLLLSNPEMFRRVTDEVRSSFASDDEITLLSVGGLTYMIACLNEALRCYPPVPIGMPRSVPRGGATIAGYAVPEDTYVGIWQWAVYHSPEHFKDPFAFRPERWMDDPRYAGDDLEIVQPFSIGPRNCIGKNLAYAEMRLILAKVVYNFDMELVDKESNWLDQRVYTLWQKPPLNVYLTPRKV